MSDDWMNPKPVEWSTTDHDKYRRENPHAILRERALITFGTGGVTQWDVWSRHPTAKERDEALDKLSREHPMWHLKPSEAAWETRIMYGRTV